MNTIDEQTIRILNGLIETCRDGQHGFETAAKDAKASDLRDIFLRFAGERGQYVLELQSQVAALGGNPDKSGSVTGSLHRGWINLKAALVSSEPAAVLVECERGEDAAVKAYRQALEGELDPESRALVVRQASGVQAAHDHVKSLRDNVLAAIHA